MRTIKRNVNSIDTSLDNYDDIVKYFQQVEWKGIIENKNIFTTDQLSQADAKNVYVDSHGSLVSREPLQEEVLPSSVNDYLGIIIDSYQYKLATNSLDIYVIDNTTTNIGRWVIATYGENIYPIKISSGNNINGKYNLTQFENYIICFNEQGAKVFDVNRLPDYGEWTNFNEVVEIPVTKRHSGSVVTEVSNNQFTTDFIEEYLVSNNLSTILPKDSDEARRNIINPDTLSSYGALPTTTLTVNNDGQTLEWRFNYDGVTDINAYIDYIKYRRLAITALDDNRLAFTHDNIVIYAGSDRMYLSYNYGTSFSLVFYPTDSTGFLNIAAISDDGEYFFYVHENAVYRYNLGPGTWTVIYPHNSSSNTIKGDAGSFDLTRPVLSHFVTGDIFTFITYTDKGAVLWFMAPGLAGYPKITDLNSNDAYRYLINDENSGLLGCSRVFLDNAQTEVLSKESFMSGQKEITNWLYKNSLRIYKDRGQMLVDGNWNYNDPTAKATGGTYQLEDYYTITLCIQNASNYPSNNAIEVFTLPGKNCPRLYESHDIVQMYRREVLSLKSIYSDVQGTHFVTGYAQNVPSDADTGRGWPTTVSGDSNRWPSDSTNFGFYYLRVDKITPISQWSTGDHFGEDNVLMNKNDAGDEAVPESICHIEGSILVLKYPELNIGDIDYLKYESNVIGWYAFTLDSALGWFISQGLSGDSPYSYLEFTARRPLGPEGNINDAAKYCPILITNNDFLWITSTDNPDGPFFTQIYKGLSDNNSYVNMINSPSRTDNLGALNILLSVHDGELLFENSQTSNGQSFYNKFSDDDLATFQYQYRWRGYNQNYYNYGNVPNTSFSSTELFLGFNNKLSITANTRDEDGNVLFSLPKLNDQKFIKPISNILNISTTEVALFFEDQIIICSKVEDETLGYRYDYYPTKLSTGTRLGDSVINTIEGTYTIFPTIRGLAFMNYQAFMATTDQVLTYITDVIEHRYDDFYAKSSSIKLIQCRERLYMTNGTGDILIYDLNRGQWWYWQVPVNISKMTTNQLDLKIVAEKIYVFKDHKIYKDFPYTENEKRIDWYVMSQPLHLNAINYYKNLKQLVFHLLDTDTNSKNHTIVVQIQCYRKRLETKEPEIITFKIDELRTFVKRFNYWKLNEVQYALGSDNENVIPTKLKLNGVSIKYELGEGVR